MHILRPDITMEDDLLDFLNLVFSQAHRPHDFKKLLPKVYAKEGFSNIHIVAKKDDRLKGAIAMLPLTINLGDTGNLSAGYIGSVAVHPYSRGEGIMKTLMQEIHAQAEKDGLDMLILGGRRLRYNYFGYENFATRLSFKLGEGSFRHGMADIDTGTITLKPFANASEKELYTAYDYFEKHIKYCANRRIEDFYNIAISWENLPYLILDDNTVKGYIITAPNGDIREFAVQEEYVLPVLKLWLAEKKAINVNAPLWNKSLINILEKIGESMSISEDAMVKVFNFEKVLSAYLNFKASYTDLLNGRVIIEIKPHGTYVIELIDGKASVNKTQEKPQISVEERYAVRLLLSPLGTSFSESSLFFNWLPLVPELPQADCF
ncbi:MAG: GNAT family N-acetyltransferase [Christensenellaceae bacterium]|nr:GNAT family N-acetyltransferase [Christensenellaceae bacterium]